MVVLFLKLLINKNQLILNIIIHLIFYLYSFHEILYHYYQNFLFHFLKMPNQKFLPNHLITLIILVYQIHQQLLYQIFLMLLIMFILFLVLIFILDMIRYHLYQIIKDVFFIITFIKFIFKIFL